MGFMSPSAPGAPPPPPPPPPTDLRQVDAELAKLGYKDPTTAGGEATVNGVALSGMNKKVGLFGRALGMNPRINELLSYRDKFNAADESVRTTGGRGLASNILAGAAAVENQKNEPLASRVLLKAY